MQQFMSSNKSLMADSSFYNSFLMNYTSREFISTFFNVGLYQSDFDVIITSSNNAEILQYFKKFLTSLSKDIKRADSLNIPIKNFLNSINVLQKIFDIRGDISSKLLSYDNILTHFPNSDPNVVKIFQEVSNNRYQTIQEFRKNLDYLVHEIKVYNETQILRIAIERWEILSTEVSEGNSSALTWLKNFKEIVQVSHTNLSELKVLSNEDTVSDYMLFYDKDSVKAVVGNLVKFLGNSFAHYKTGYEVIDKNIDGIESSSVSIITGPSNHKILCGFI